MDTNKKTARTAGLVYLIILIGGLFAEFFVRSRVMAAGNAALTTGNIMGSQGLYRLGFVIDIFSQVAYLIVALLLYKLFKPVNKTVAMLCVLLISISTSIACLNLLNQFAAVYLLTDTTFAAAFTADQLNTLSYFFLNMQKYGYIIGDIFFGGWFIPLGYLVYKSGYFPKALGIILNVAALGFLVDFTGQFLFPDNAAVISNIGYVLATPCEWAFFFWLIFRGAKEALPAAQVAKQQPKMENTLVTN
jgi:hypothetical protein